MAVWARGSSEHALLPRDSQLRPWNQGKVPRAVRQPARQKRLWWVQHTPLLCSVSGRWGKCLFVPFPGVPIKGPSWQSLSIGVPGLSESPNPCDHDSPGLGWKVETERSGHKANSSGSMSCGVSDSLWAYLSTLFYKCIALWKSVHMRLFQKESFFTVKWFSHLHTVHSSPSGQLSGAKLGLTLLLISLIGTLSLTSYWQHLDLPALAKLSSPIWRNYNKVDSQAVKAGRALGGYLLNNCSLSPNLSL